MAKPRKFTETPASEKYISMEDVLLSKHLKNHEFPAWKLERKVYQSPHQRPEAKSCDMSKAPHLPVHSWSLIWSGTWWWRRRTPLLQCRAPIQRLHQNAQWKASPRPWGLQSSWNCTAESDATQLPQLHQQTELQMTSSEPMRPMCLKLSLSHLSTLQRNYKGAFVLGQGSNPWRQGCEGHDGTPGKLLCATCGQHKVLHPIRGAKEDLQVVDAACIGKNRMVWNSGAIIPGDTWRLCTQFWN